LKCSTANLRLIQEFIFAQFECLCLIKKLNANKYYVTWYHKPSLIFHEIVSHFVFCSYAPPTFLSVFGKTNKYVDDDSYNTNFSSIKYAFKLESPFFFDFPSFNISYDMTWRGQKLVCSTAVDCLFLPEGRLLFVLKLKDD